VNSWTNDTSEMYHLPLLPIKLHDEETAEKESPIWRSLIQIWKRDMLANIIRENVTTTTEISSRLW